MESFSHFLENFEEIEQYRARLESWLSLNPVAPKAVRESSSYQKGIKNMIAILQRLLTIEKK
jgi:hypothetical protein